MVAVRRRGIDHVDRSDADGRTLHLPMVESLLADRGLTGTRSQQLRAVLPSWLAALQSVNSDAAQTLRGLYFDPRTGRSPGPPGPGALLGAGRRQHQQSEATFRRTTRNHLIQMGELVLPPTAPPTRPRRLLLGALGGVFVVGAICVALVLLAI